MISEIISEILNDLRSISEILNDLGNYLLGSPFSAFVLFSQIIGKFWIFTGL